MNSKVFIMGLITIVAIAVIMLVLLLVTPRSEKIDIRSLKASVCRVSGREVLVIEGINNSPCSNVQLINVTMDYDKKEIRIEKLLIYWLPFQRDIIYNRYPVVIDDALLPKTYAIKIWDGGRFINWGRLEVREDRTLELSQEERKSQSGL